MLWNVRRQLQVVFALWRYLVLPAIPPWRRRARSGPVRLRTLFERLGGVWVKMGQNLALRFDLLPPEYCNELYKLLNTVKPFPYRQARAIIRQELGAYPEEIFPVFEREPFASASIGQVYRARLPTGEQVAVKVQRPNIRRIVRVDIGSMYFVAGLLDTLGLSGGTSNRDVVDEFVRWLNEELDYRTEARHARIVRENSDGDPNEYNVRVFTEYSTSRVLTTELLEGIPLIDIVYAVREHNTAYLDGLRACGYDLERIVWNIDWNLLNQVFVYGYFHADLHPANIFVLPNNSIGYIDFGIIGRLSDSLRESLLQYNWHLFQGNANRSTEELMRWLVPSPNTDVEAARQELNYAVEDYLFRLHDPKRKAMRHANANLGTDLLNLIRKHSLALHPNAVAYLKTMIAVDAIRFELAPNYDLEYVVNLFFGRMIAQETRELFNFSSGYAYQLAFDYSLRMRRAMRSFDQQEQVFGSVGNRALRLWRRLQVFGALAIAVALGLYVILAFPALRSPAGVGNTGGWTPLVLLGVLVALIISIIRSSQRLSVEERPPNQIGERRRGGVRRRTLR